MRPSSPLSLGEAVLALALALALAPALSFLLAGCSTEPPVASAHEVEREAQEERKPILRLRLDPHMEMVLEELTALAPKPIPALAPQEARRQPNLGDAAVQVLQRQGTLAPEPRPAVAKVETRLLDTSNGPLRAKIYTPRAAGGAPPIVVYFHGGGFVLASTDAYDASCRALAEGARAIVVGVDYRLAPEHRFPTAHEDAYAAFQYVAEHARQLGGDPARVAVAGESAGGNLATAVCLLAHERGGRMPVHQVLVYPVTDYRFDARSYREHGDAKPLSAEMMRWFFGHYLNEPEDGASVLVSPLRADPEQLGSLPPATVLTAGIDPLRSEGLEYAERLRNAGVDTALQDFPLLTHEFFGLAAVVPEARAAQELVAARLRAAFGIEDEGPARDAAAAVAPPAAPLEHRETTPAAPGGSAAAAVVRGGAARGAHAPALEVLAEFPGPAMPTGVTVSREGRVFVCFPRWSDPVPFTAAELREGVPVAFPDAATNAFDPAEVELPARGSADFGDRLVSVQSVVIDARDRLWMVDSGSIALGPTLPGAPKLVAFDLASGQRTKVVMFPPDVVMKRSYLNDVRIDTARGEQGMAFLTDSGMGGVIVVDLATGRSWRHLDGHPAVLSAPGLDATTEGEPFLQRLSSGEVRAPDIRSDGIALSPDGETLYLTPLVSRDVFAVPTAVLARPDADPQAVRDAVRKVATKPSANDGLICDPRGRLYSTDWEDHAIRRIDPESGEVEVVCRDERLIWPDTLAWMGDDLCIMSNQLARQPSYHFGTDLRAPPYVLFVLRGAASR
jgi:acetyl esterase/lipase/sugar lactone lactonase YvrE